MPASTPPSYPIDTAPTLTGATLLLWPRGGGHWRLGYWDGKTWCDEAGFVVDPIAWALLPDPPAEPPVSEPAD
jgi:hypothetical protein